MRALIILCVLVAAGCTSVPVIDNSARVPATVRIENVSYAGSQGYFAYTGKQTIWTHGNQRRIQQNVEFTESALGVFGADAERAYLFDLETPALRLLDYDTGQVRECDLLGCFEYSERSRAVSAQPPVVDAKSCGLTVEQSQFSLQPAAGRSAEQRGSAYTLDWRINYRDDQQREGASRLYGTVWLDPPEAGDRAANQRESDFWQAYAAATDTQWPGLYPVVPWVPLAVVEKYFLSTLTASDHAETVAAVELPELNGEAVAGELQWQLLGEACGINLPDWKRRKQAQRPPQADEEARQSEGEAPADGIETAEDFFAAIVDEFSGNKAQRESAATPPAEGESSQSVTSPQLARTVFSYAWELETLVNGQVSDNQLSVPEEFETGSRF